MQRSLLRVIFPMLTTVAGEALVAIWVHWLVNACRFSDSEALECEPPALWCVCVCGVQGAVVVPAVAVVGNGGAGVAAGAGGRGEASGREGHAPGGGAAAR